MNRSRLAELARLAFWPVMVLIVTMALLPKPPHLPIDRFGDKFEHMLAFATLTLLGHIAFPQAERWRMAERLCFLGAAIEVAQSIPVLHRDCQFSDWLADSVVVLVLTLLFAARARFASTRPLG